MDSSLDPNQEETILADLSRLPWTKGLGEQAFREIANAADFLQAGAGDVIHRAEDRLTAVYFVTHGRLLASERE